MDQTTYLLTTGDVFSCHAVDNPSVQSELNMLRQYGPSVPDQTLKKLVGAFGELRDMADRGLISYPYSTREVVNIVKHLEVSNHNWSRSLQQNFMSRNLGMKE